MLVSAAYVAGTRHTSDNDKALTPLVQRSRIMLPGVLGRIDHFGYDGRRGNIFGSALGNNTAAVANHPRVVHTIRGPAHPPAAVFPRGLPRPLLPGTAAHPRFFARGSSSSP